MYEIINQVIAKGGYKLEEIRYKIKKLFAYGDLTEAQTDALLEKASAGISAEAERPEVMQMLRTLGRQLEALEQRGRAGTVFPLMMPRALWFPTTAVCGSPCMPARMCGSPVPPERKRCGQNLRRRKLCSRSP